MKIFRLLLITLVFSILSVSITIQAQPDVDLSNLFTREMTFEENVGAWDIETTYIARGVGYTLHLNPTEATFVLEQSTDNGVNQSYQLTMSLAGGNPEPQIAGEALQRGTSHYFIGNDPTRWMTNGAHYGAVRYHDVYDGIDLVYYGNQRELQYDFVLAPHTTPDTIQIQFDHVDQFNIDTNGDLLLTLGEAMIRQHAPITYQDIDGERVYIPSRFIVHADNTIGFEVDDYDSDHVLVIDPVLNYSTYVGGDNAGSNVQMAVVNNRDLYVLSTISSTFFANLNASHDLSSQNATPDYVVVSHIDMITNEIIFTTTIGGSGNDYANDIVIGRSGNIYIVGDTSSTDFPTANAYQSSYGGGDWDAFVLKLHPDGNTIMGSSYFGGSGADFGQAIALTDRWDHITITGVTASNNFPRRYHVQSNQGGYDAFVAQFNSSTSTLYFSTYLGGDEFDEGRDIAIDEENNIIVVGTTLSDDFPVVNGLQTTHNGGTVYGDIFVTVLASSGQSFSYSTYLGGDDEEHFPSVTVANDTVYVSGETRSDDFPTQNAYDTSLGGDRDVFVTALNPALSGASSLVYSTYLGGSDWDTSLSMTSNNRGEVYLTGVTSSTDFPTQNALQDTFQGAGAQWGDAFVTNLSIDGTSLLYSSFLGGSQDDIGQSIHVVGQGSVYIAGLTNSTNFPVTNGSQNQVGTEAFVLNIMAGVGDCDGTAGDDTITCDSNPTTPDAIIDGGLGNDDITVANGVTVGGIYSDSPSGGTEAEGDGGDDTLVINGPVLGDIYTDYVTGNGGADHITVNAPVSGDIYLDNYDYYFFGPDTLYHGSNTLILNSDIGGDIYTGGGDDVIIIDPNTTTGGADNTLSLHIAGDNSSVRTIFHLDGTPLATLEAIQEDFSYDGNDRNGTINGQFYEDFPSTIFYAELPAGDCDGTTGNDTITCTITPTSPNDRIDAEGGDDEIIIPEGVTVGEIRGDGSLNFDRQVASISPAGNDTITVHGTAGGISGDNTSGDGGDDIITIYGEVSAIDGDRIAWHYTPDYVPHTLGSGGDDIIHNYGTVTYDGVLGDMIWINQYTRLQDVTVRGGDDTIINDGTMQYMDGDLLFGDVSTQFQRVEEYRATLIGGNDTLINNGTLNSTITGDTLDGGGIGGDDTIINTGSVTNNIFGEYIISYFEMPVTGGMDIITNSGFVGGDIWGDWVEVVNWVWEPQLNDYDFDYIYVPEAGASDIITNSGTVVGTIYGAGGDDRIILQDGANGGDDNDLPIDGGAGFDTLDFSFTNLDQSTIDTINASDPANGSITIDGETFTWTNFEAFSFNELCPDGTAGDDTIVCQADPPVGTNMDTFLEGNAGQDHITIALGVSVYRVFGDGWATSEDGFDDVIINHGSVNTIEGDFVGGAGGDDIITNTGLASSIRGDFSDGDGGNDQLINSGTAIDLTGDGNSDSNGGNDTILNEVDGESFFLIGDDLSAAQSDITLTGGQDFITNHGDATLILGDALHQQLPEASNVTLIGNDDTIWNTGEADYIFGDYISYDANSTALAGQDTITNTGIVTQNIYGDGLSNEFGEGENSEPLIVTGEGASDIIANSGTVGGTIFAEGGDDRVILRDGANGGDDNNLPLDGGDGYDTLDFSFSTLDQSTIDAINASDPANGSITIDGQTFTWTNFEAFGFNDLCPDGTAGNDVIICQASPPIGTNDDANLTGGAGVDDITINADVTVYWVIGDGQLPLEDDSLPNFDDVILNHGTVTTIFADRGGGNGGDDTITNTGEVGIIFGDASNGDGGNDQLINSGFAFEMNGDGITNSNGGDDTLLNTVTGEMHLLFGDSLGANESNLTLIGGDDTITNDGITQFIDGDYIYESSGVSNLTMTGGNDTILNSGETDTISGDSLRYLDYVVGNDVAIAGADTITNIGIVNMDIFGDGISVDGQGTGEGASDTITNSGTVGGTIFAEGGDDLVTLQNGANGGDDNNLPLDGGSGFDTLDFAFTGMSQATKDLIDAADPANGSITIGGQTFTWTNFEALTTSNFVPAPTVPPAPDGLTIDGDLTVAPVQPTYTWNDVGTATWYYVQLSRGGTTVFQTWFEVGVDVVCDVTCSITPEISLSNGEHTWWVQGYNDIGTGAWSDGDTFDVDVPAPTKPTNLNLRGNLTAENMRLIFEWDHDTPNTWYQLYISNNSGVVIDTWYEVGGHILTCDEQCSTTLAITLPNGEYSWWVNAYNSVGSVWSEEDATFTVAIPTPTIPTDLTIVGDLTAVPVQPTYEWTRDPNVTWYQLYVTGPSGVVIDTWYQFIPPCGETCSVTPDVTLADGEYSWWVNAYNSVGNVWSDTATFTVDTLTSLVPINLQVSGELDEDPVQPTYSWGYHSDVTWYQLYVTGPNGVVIDTWYEAGEDIYCSITCQVTPEVTFSNGEYSWWVNAYRAESGNIWSDEATFTVNMPVPVAPTGLHLIGNSSGEFPNPAYRWDRDVNATWYQLYVTGPNGVVVDIWYDVYPSSGLPICTQTRCTARPDVILPNGEYSWWVNAYNNQGSIWSDVVTFTVSVPAPTVPTGLTTSEVVYDPLYQWTHDPNTTWYQLQVNDESGAVIQTWLEVGYGRDITCGSTCRFNSTTRLENGTYTWRVQAYNSVGTSAWSDTATHIVDLPLPTQPTNLTLSGNLTEPFVQNLMFQWQHGANTNQYQVQINDASGTVISNQVYLPNRSYYPLTCDVVCVLEFPDDLENGTYTWWVKAENAVGSVWSEAATFTIAITPPAQPTNLSASDPNAQPIQYTWSHDPLTTWYIVQINLGSNVVIQEAYEVGYGVTCDVTCSLVIPQTLSSGTYTWWVHGWTYGHGDGAWSDTAAFTVP